MCNLLCGVAVGISGANAAIADASDPQLFVKVLVIEIFSRCVFLSVSCSSRSSQFVD